MVVGSIPVVGIMKLKLNFGACIARYDKHDYWKFTLSPADVEWLDKTCNAWRDGRVWNIDEIMISVHDPTIITAYVRCVRSTQKRTVINYLVKAGFGVKGLRKVGRGRNDEYDYRYHRDRARRHCRRSRVYTVGEENFYDIEWLMEMLHDDEPYCNVVYGYSHRTSGL